MADFNPWNNSDTLAEAAGLPPITKEGLVTTQLPNPTVPESLGNSVPSATTLTKSSAVEVVKFPNDLGEVHIPDFIAFYFLDIATKDEKGAVKFINQGSNIQPYGAPIVQSSKQPIMSTNPSVATFVKAAAGFAGEKGTEALNATTGMFGKAPIGDPTAVGQSFEQNVGSFLHLNDTYMRTTDVVHLMMPSSIQFNDGAGWQAVNAAPTMMGLMGQVVMSDTPLKELAGTAGFGIAKMISNTLYESGAAAMESVAKKVYNPYVSQAFESMNRRSFRFDWVLTPKNQDELDNIFKIVRLFRYHMHPSLSAGDMFLRYPSQLEVEFKVDNSENNDWLPRVATCVIKDFSTNYTPNNQWSTLNTNGPKGAPAQYQISVTVEEIVPLVKEDINQGF